MSQPKKASVRNAPDPDMPRRKTQLQQAKLAAGVTHQRAILNKKEREKRLATLDSVVDGLQSEVEKLLKKSPVDLVSDMMLEQVNQAIRDTRSLLADDEYVQRQKEFVPAGENPEIRDVSLALTQMKKGLQRFKSTGKAELDQAEQAVEREAHTVALALDMYVGEKRKQIRDVEIRTKLGGVSREWVNNRGLFDFERLDATDLADYFNLDS